MNKEELIKNLKYTMKKHENDKIDTFGTNVSLMCTDTLGVLNRCVELPENPTNGDVIIALFPNHWFCKSMVDGYVNHTESLIGRDTKTMYFDLDWWNAPYEGGNGNGE